MKERIVIEEGIDEREVPIREPVPPRQLGPVPFAGTGPERGEHEDLRSVEYIAPRRRAA